jgi:exonuclease SbcC
MITEVKLRGWRSHLDSEFNFSNGTNALLGHMGSGKTTVLDGICFGLFGTFPTLQTRKLKLDDIIIKKPTEKNRAEVEISFQANGANYSVKRVVEKGKGTTYSEIRQDGKLIESPNSQRVTEIIEKILKVNYDLFSKAIYSEQNALDYFLTIPKSQRMKKIDDLLMIDKFEKARAGAVTLANRIVERKLAKQSTVEKINLDELEKNISDLKSSLEKFSAEKEMLKENLEKVTSEKTQLEREVSELKKIKEELESLRREEKGVNSAIQETFIILDKFERKLKDLDPISVEKNLRNLSRLVKDLDGMIKEKQESYQKLQEKSSKSRAEIEILRKEKIENLETKLKEKLRIKEEVDEVKKSVGEDIEKKKEKKKKLIEKIVGEIESTRTKIIDLEEVIAQLSSVKNICPLCESKLTKIKKRSLIKKKKSQIKSLKQDLEKTKREKILTERELKNLEEAVSKLSEMLREIKDFDEIKIELENSKNVFKVLNESSKKFETELSDLKKELESLQEKFKKTTNEKQRFDLVFSQLKEYGERKNRVDALTKEREKISLHIKSIENRLTGKELDKQETLLRNLIGKEKELSTKASSLEQLVGEREARLKDFDQVFENAQKEKDEIKKLDRLIRELKIFEEALKHTQAELRKEFVTAVNYTMNNLWSTLYPYQDFTRIKLGIEEGDYVLQLQEPSGRLVGVEGVASGGERSIACLALRIGLSLVLAPQLRMLILDEPTANLDSRAIKELAKTLRERVGDFIDQTFLITHQTELEDAVTGSAYRLKRDKEKDEVTKILSIV